MKTYDSYTGEIVRIQIRALEGALVDGFLAAGMGREEAVLIANALVESELRGNPTHGLMRFSWYVAALREETIIGAERSRIATARVGSVVTIRADGTYGYLPTAIACEELIPVASELGIAMALVSGIAEFGRASIYSRMLAHDGLIGVAMQNTPPMIKAPGGNRPVVGNNPLAYSIPGRVPSTFDAAFTVRSAGELHLRRVLGVSLPEEWGYTDEAGEPTTDPNAALSTAQDAVGGAKGFGIAMLIDLLAGVLSGARNSIDVRPGRPDVGACLVAIDPRTAGSSPTLIEAAMAILRDSITDSGGRWMGERSDVDLAAALRIGEVSVPAAIVDDVNVALGTLNLPHIRSTSKPDS